MKDLKARLYEQTLILRCQTRDEAAFQQIVQLYDAPLRYFLRRITPDETFSSELFSTKNSSFCCAAPVGCAIQFMLTCSAMPK